MADFAVLTLMLPPPGVGDFWCTRLEDGSIRVDQADPRILISADLLYKITDVLVPPPGVSLRWPSPPPASGRFLYNGAVLTIHGVNRTVIYRITEYVPRVHGYVAEWPD
jgi:hypothetical protein